MKEVLLVAGVIIFGAFLVFGYVIYKVGEEMATMSRCGCRDRGF